MIRVLIDDDNAFYREGLWHFIKKNFASSDYGTLELLETSQENLVASDIVVKIFQMVVLKFVTMSYYIERQIRCWLVYAVKQRSHRCHGYLIV